jgi:hypothetical protein
VLRFGEVVDGGGHVIPHSDVAGLGVRASSSAPSDLGPFARVDRASLSSGEGAGDS